MKQQALFPDSAVPAVPGFVLREDYIEADEEQRLLAHVDEGPWENDWRRRIQQYGFGYGSGSKRPVWRRDFPPWLTALAERIAKDAAFEQFPDNCVINEYVPPLGIGPHKDYSDFADTVACVSLGSDIVLDFTYPERHLRVPVNVPVRSLWVIRGEARSVWRHGIAARLSDIVAGERRVRGRRISITFRNLKKKL